ncbi:MAG: chondroitinase family polysaccharide lyase, partial [Lentisphaerota bacterium]
WLPALVPLEKMTDSERQDLDKLAARFKPAWGAPEKDPNIRQKVADTLGIRRADGIITGHPIKNGYNCPPDAVDSMLVTTAKNYVCARDEKRKEDAEQLLELYVDVAEHAMDQGVSEGSRNTPYGGIIGMMQEELKDPRLRGLALSAAYWAGGDALEAEDLTDVAWGWGKGAEQWNNTDYFFYSFYLLPQTLVLIADPAIRLQRFRAFKGFVDRLCDPKMGEPFAMDYTVHHHQMHHVAYGDQMFGRLMNNILPNVHDTCVRPSPAALETMKRYALASAFSSANDFAPPSIPGYAGCPHPHLLATWSFVLANCGTPDDSKPVDPDMASLYLATVKGLEPKPEQAKKFEEMGFSPMKFDGHLTQNGAAAAMHRRDDWLVSMVGMNRSRRGKESNYLLSMNNRFARNGAVDVYSSGDPLSFAASGYRADGWDYRFWPGTTSIVTPPEGTIGWTTGGYSSSPMGGGTSMDKDGVWGFECLTNDPGVMFHKSAFCFGDRVTVITTDIRHGEGVKTEEKGLPFVTTLFQCAFGLGGPDAAKYKSVPPETEPCVIDGKEIKEFPYEIILPSGLAHWLIDNKGDGFHIPAGNPPVSLKRRAQSWTYCYKPNYMKPPAERTNEKGWEGNPKNFNPTSGDFALAWFEHGSAPEFPECVYTIIPRATPERMAKFAAKMSDPLDKPYLILQKDAMAHILWDKASDTIGYIIFNPAWRPGNPKDESSRLLS